MDIRYHGLESITIKNKALEILVGVTFPLAKNDDQRLLIASPTCGEVSFASIPDDKVLINGPGDYEVGGVDINGFVYGKKSIFYTIVIDGYKVGLLFEDGAIMEEKLVSMVKKSGTNFLILVGKKETYKEVVDVFDREDIEKSDKFVLKEGEEVAEGMEVVLLS